MESKASDTAGNASEVRQGTSAGAADKAKESPEFALSAASNVASTAEDTAYGTAEGASGKAKEGTN